MSLFTQVTARRINFNATLIMVLSACMLVGCAKSKEVTFKSGGMTHTFAEGQNAVPGDFPLPVYPGAQATGSVSAQGDKTDEQSRFLLLSSSDSVDKIRDFYEKQLPSSGWKVETSRSMPQVFSISATRDDLDAAVMVSSEGEKSIINISVSKDSDAEPEPVDKDYSPEKLTPPTD